MASSFTPPTPVLEDDTLYIGDNGAVLCGRHSGASARYSGLDISGQPVAEVPNELAKEHALACETCRAEDAR